MDENLVETEFKYSHGEINTPFSFVNNDLMFQDFLIKNNKWLDQVADKEISHSHFFNLSQNITTKTNNKRNVTYG